MRRNTRTCFQCGKPGHFVADCPEKFENKDGYKHKSRTDGKTAWVCFFPNQSIARLLRVLL
jgi:hypothetical protein